MWPRTVEIMLGCWLLVSPFIYSHSPDETALWIADLAAGSMVIIFALLSFSQKTRHAHLLTIAVAIGLIIFGYLYQPHPAPPALQNDVLIGWLLIMFTIMPNQVNIPPPGWREYNVSHGNVDQKDGPPLRHED